MVRSIELENNGARNLYAEMLKVIVETGYPKSYPVDILVDFEIITENKLYEEGKSFVWIIRELGTHLYYENYTRDHEVFKMHFENSIKHVYLVTMGKWDRVYMTEIIPTFQNAYEAYHTLPDHVYEKEE